ncbi:MAG TPA: heme exporter protein CcmB [Bryobacteraceae bacterium]|nr:heme exporter protein CcmB [Bryobacteraceae bacterium]
MLRQALSVARKDLSIELRTKESLNASIAFAISILLLFSFAFDAVLQDTVNFAAGLLWLVVAFAGALVFNRGFARELPNECLDALLASPLSAASLVIGKALANLAMLLVVELVSLVVFGIFFNVHWTTHPLFLAILFLLATWGISLLGAVFGALTVNLRLRELMLPVIIYPVLVPLLIAAIEITNTLLSIQPVGATEFAWGKMLVVFDIVFTALAVFLADTILVN